MTPISPIVEALLCRLDDNLREAFEERAGIGQFEAGHPRELAEALAMLDVIRMNQLCVSEVRALRVRLRGEERILLTVSRDLPSEPLADVDGELVGAVDLVEVLQQLGPYVLLSPIP